MTQFFLNTSESVEDLSDKQQNGFNIEKLVKEEDMGYIEATVYWLETNSLAESSYQRYIPNAIIDKIKLEVVENNILRPSILGNSSKNTLDFLL